MSQPRAKRGFAEFRHRKQHVKEALRDPHPLVTAMVDRKTGKILCIGTSRARLMEYCGENGWDDFDMQDFYLVI